MIQDISDDPHNGKILPIVRVFVFNDRKECLLLRREKHPYRGHWEVVGGKIEFGETHENAAARELLEEAGITAVPRFLGVHEHIDEGYHRIMFSYFVKVKKPNPKTSEHKDFHWFAKDELPRDIIPRTKEGILEAHSML